MRLRTAKHNRFVRIPYVQSHELPTTCMPICRFRRDPKCEAIVLGMTTRTSNPDPLAMNPNSKSPKCHRNVILPNLKPHELERSTFPGAAVRSNSSIVPGIAPFGLYLKGCRPADSKSDGRNLLLSICLYDPYIRTSIVNFSFSVNSHTRTKSFPNLDLLDKHQRVATLNSKCLGSKC